MESTTVKEPVAALNRHQIEVRLKACPSLPSLSTINSALKELLNADHRYTAQISEIIRRDPSLTARLLRLVNSVFYGLTTPVNSIEEAVFYLGVRQIRQLSMVTPIIEDFQKLAGKSDFQWREFWRHCIGTAILTREIISHVGAPADDGDYVAGLIHDVGKIAMASAYPTHFAEIRERMSANPELDLVEVEREVLGIDHAELGSMYLKNNNLPELLIEAARWHHEPENAKQEPQIIAAVQIADLVIRQASIGGSGATKPVSQEDWANASGWQILFPKGSQEDIDKAVQQVAGTLDRLPTLLEGLV